MNCFEMFDRLKFLLLMLYFFQVYHRMEKQKIKNEGGKTNKAFQPERNNTSV